MMRNQRVRRREAHKHAPRAPLSSFTSSSSVLRVLVVYWTLCLTLQKAPCPCVAVASSSSSSAASSFFSGTVGPGTWQQQQQQSIQGSPSSDDDDDEGSDDVESNSENSETRQRLTCMVIPDNQSTGEVADSSSRLSEHEALREEETATPEDREELSNVPLLDLDWHDEDRDETTGVTMFESDQDDAEEGDDTSEDVPETSESDEEHIVVVSGMEVEWLDSDSSASVAKSNTSTEGQPGHGHAKAVVNDKVEETVVKSDEKPRQDDNNRECDEALSLRQAAAVEEVMDESDGVNTEEEETEAPRAPLHQAMAVEELMDGLDDVDTDEEAEEAKAPRVSSSAQQVNTKESGGTLEEDNRATEGALPLRQDVAVDERINESDRVETEDEDNEEAELRRASSPVQHIFMEGSTGFSEEEGVPEEPENPTQQRSELQTFQEIESEDESSNWSDDEKSGTDDGESDIDDVMHSATSRYRDAIPEPSEHGTVVTPEEFDEAAPEKAHRTKSVAFPHATVVPSKKQERNIVRSRQWYPHPSAVASPSQPLKTLKKLQQMLDETDYMTATPGPRGDEVTREAPIAQSGNERVWFDQGVASREYGEGDPSTFGVSPNSIDKRENNAESDKLWTSKDRMKYKKQQQRIRRAKAEQRRIEKQLHSPPLYPNTSDGEITEDSTDDGLGYTLPNLPVYFSDTEGTTDLTDDTDHPLQLQQSTQQQSTLQPPPPPFEQRGPYQYPGYHYPYNAPPLPEKNVGQIPPYMSYPYIPYPPYGPYGPQQQQMYGQQMYTSQYAAWAAASNGMSPYGAARPPHNPSSRQTAPRKPDFPHSPSTGHEPKSETAKAGLEVAHKRVLSSTPVGGFPVAAAVPAVSPATQVATTANVGQPSTLTESRPQLNFDSLQKMSILAIGVALSCYCAVSPRTLPSVDYNIKLFENIKTVALAMIAPTFHFIFVFDPKENDVNRAVNALYEAMTVGYGLAFLLQILFTTLIRLAVFAWFEPDVFKLTPRVPALVLPWVLRENQYRPKRITLFAADYATSCVAGPIIEEYIKLKILQWSSSLPRNFRWTTKVSAKNMKHKRKVAEVIPRTPGDAEVTKINSYVSQMLAVSIGIKLCDSTRRVLMYTKDHQANKGFYALCRGIFPIHELCGTMTALALAKRDVLGWDMPLWKMLAPAVVVHGMANFRGMKPIFKWNSATPWSEMQLAPWNTAVALNKGFAQFMWLIILGRVLGYCVKNYYLIRRQAVKRTTTYAGKRAAFSAELAAAEMLKKTANDK